MIPLRPFLYLAVIPVALTLSLSSCDDPGSAANQKKNQQTVSSSSNQNQQSATLPASGTARNSVPNKKMWPPIADDVEIVPNKFVKNYVLVFDGSGSMRETACKSDKNETKTAVAKKAGVAFVDQVSPEDNIGLITFDGRGIVVRAPLGINNRDVLKKEILAIGADSGTPLGVATELAYKELTKQAQRQLGYGEYHLILLTDGEASDTSIFNRIVEEILTHSPIIVHGMGFCVSKNHSMNQPGRTIYKEAGNFRELLEGLQSVLAESPDFIVKEFNKK